MLNETTHFLDILPFFQEKNQKEIPDMVQCPGPDSIYNKFL